MGLLLQAVMALTSVATTGISLSAANRKPTPTKPEASAEVGNEGAIAAQRMAEMRRQQQGKGGRASTILSGSPLGQPAPATTAKKYLTGQ
jgi:hypothetical protein